MLIITLFKYTQNIITLWKYNGIDRTGKKEKKRKEKQWKWIKYLSFSCMVVWNEIWIEYIYIYIYIYNSVVEGENIWTLDKWNKN